MAPVVVGIVLILASILFNPAFVERYLSSDHDLDTGAVKKVYIFEGIVFAAGILFLLVSHAFKIHTAFKEKIVANFFILACSTVFTLLLLEISLKIVNAYIMPFNRQRHIFFQYDEILGWRHRPNRKSTMKNTRVEINAHGVRGDDIPYEKPAGEFRLLFLGDSQIFGDGVEAADTFPQLLEERFKDVKSINAAVIGYGTDQQLLYLRNEGMKYSPDVIVVGLNAFDFQDNISDKVRSGYAKPMFKFRENVVIETNIPVPQFGIVTRLNRGLKNLSHLYFFATTGLRRISQRTGRTEGTTYNTDSILPPPSQLADSTRITQWILKEIAVEGRKAKATTIVAFLPYDFDFGGYPDYQSKIESLCRQLQRAEKDGGFIFLDVRNELQKKTIESSLFLDTMHFNSEGHKVVAQILADFLVDRKILSY